MDAMEIDKSPTYCDMVFKSNLISFSNDDFQYKALKYFIEEFLHILDKGWIQRSFSDSKCKEEHKSLQGDLGKVGDPILTHEDCRNEEEDCAEEEINGKK